jgi:hypothetical protein
MYKIGTFFIFLGIFLIVLYLFSDLANAPALGLLVAGGILSLIGIWMWTSDRPKKEKRSERFRILKQAKDKPPRGKGSRSRRAKKNESEEEQEE